MSEEQYTELNEALDNLNSNTEGTNNAIDELHEYLLEKDEREQEAKQEQEQNDAEQIEADEQEAQAQQDVYTEALFDIRDELQFQNQLIAGQFMMMGIIAGIILFKILWDKFQ